VVTASDGQPLAAVAVGDKRRVVIDGGWTRYYYSGEAQYVTQTAGTIRYAENIAAFLMGKNRRASVPSDPNDVLGLLDVLAQETDAKRREPIVAALEKASPKYADVKEQIGEILAHAASEDRDVARLAKAQITNAFARAPMSDTLVALGSATPDQAALIWDLVEQRIARADAARLASYRDSAVQILSNRGSPEGAQRASLELLGRLKDRQAVAPLVDQLTQLPRTLWPLAGETLASMTGENHGPKPGDGVAEVVAAAKKWRKWVEDNPQ
jgi:hypothetical protein